MSIGLVVVLCSGFGVLGALGVVAASALENVGIARATGRDPRKQHMTMKTTGEKSSQALVEAGERLARDGST